MPVALTQLDLERARVRDLLRYYRPNLKRPHPQRGSLLELRDEPQSCSDAAPSSPSGPVAAELPDDSRLLFHDPTLTAFAQLGAFRLNCQRSFISLMDHDSQYILAEATRSVSLVDQNACDSGDEIYLGPRVLDMVWGVCPSTIQVFTAKDGHLNVETPLVVANQNCYVMNDLSAIESFKNRPYVAGWPFMKFYAEVPIHSPTGFVIGTFCVVDNRPRNGLDKKGLDALNEIASAIMKHLELIQMQHNLQRAGKMVKGLGVFVEGKSTLWMEGEEGGLGSLPGRPRIQRNPTIETLSTGPESKEGAPDATYLKSSTYNSSLPPKISEAKVETRDQKTSSISDATPPSASRERTLSMNDAVVLHESIKSAGTKQLFSRACYLIRESLNLDGIIFVDAFVHDMAIEPVNFTTAEHVDSLRFRAMTDSPAFERTEWLGSEGGLPVLTNSFPDYEYAPKRPKSARQSSSSELLGYSIQTDVSERISFSSQYLPLPQSTLRELLQNYGDGHTFVYDKEGFLVQDADERNERRGPETLGRASNAETDPEKEKSVAKQLLEICPGARSIIFFPLWDPQRNRWFAGSLAWTNDPARIIQSTDITYLAAFGNCIMSEKSRLDALTADRAKADFISSVSHEIRSPLHGVLASAEALQETSTDPMQDDMIRTILVCGEALLDTMDQILDYAKTSNSANKSRSNPKQKLDSQTQKDANSGLCFLVESVVEGIFSGHIYRKSKSRSLNGHQIPATLAASTEDVMIILNIDWQASSIFESESGAWKRILMNLFGNALKYTQAGFVQVSLKCDTSAADPEFPSKKLVILQIDDSGKGMSQDYLKYQLFTPFAQEDSMVEGIGLGLSIVRQLATDLGGKIDIQSEVGYGTTVKVSVSLETTPQVSDSAYLGSSTLISEVRRRSEGLTICFVAFEYYPDIRENPTGILSTHARRMLALKSSITKMAWEWFGMIVSASSSLTSAKGNILIGLHSNTELSEGHMQKEALIIFEDVMGGGRPQDARGVFYLSQPVGPYKLARTLALCLDYNASVTDDHHEFTDIMAKAGTLVPNIIPENPISEDHIDKHYTVDIQTVPTAIGDPQVRPSLFAHPHESQVETNATDKMVSKIPYHTSVTSSGPPQSKVLLVEDNVINMKILVQYMEKVKRDYVTAANGLEALQIFKADPLSFRVILMDLSMPVMDGLTSSRHIRTYEQENSLPRTRIIALTCFSSAEYQQDAALSGVDMFLIKPVSMKTLKPILDLDRELFPGVD